MGSKQQKMSWFAKPSILRFSKSLAIGATAASFFTFVLPNTLLVDVVKLQTQLCKNDEEIDISQSLQPLVDEVIRDLQLTKKQKDLVSIYSIAGFEFIRAGSLSHLSSKVALGIPANYRYENLQDFDPTDYEGVLKSKQDSDSWNLPETLSLKESQILSRDAKKFAIARELIMMNSPAPFITGLFTSQILLLYYTVTSTLNLKLNLFYRPFIMRLNLYSLLSLIGYVTWIFGIDYSTVHMTSQAEEEIVNISENYAKGGFEYYEKIILRNKALRVLVGKVGGSQFTEDGEDEDDYRIKHLPYNESLDKMKAKVEEYQKSQKDSGKVAEKSTSQDLKSSPLPNLDQNAVKQIKSEPAAS